MLQSFTFWTGVLAVLIVYLGLSVGLRRLLEEKARAKRERLRPTGKAFDVATVAPLVQRVRQDPIGASHSRSHPAFHRPGLIAAARRMVSGCSYFRRARCDAESEK